MISAVFNQPFEEQLAFFKQKVSLPTQRWDDIQRAAHDRAFVVAGAVKADLIADLRGAVEKAIAQGTTLDEFRRDFKTIVRKHGWMGWKGEGTKAGEAWRTKVIWETNLLTSHAAGRYAQMTDPEVLATRPYWQYRHADYVARPRPLHVSWHGLVLPANHTWFKTHWPPNGWGCHCKIRALSARDIERLNLPISAPPDDGFDEHVDANTGAVTHTPAGIDRGWDYAPGRTWAPALDKYPEALARQVVNEYARDGVFERWYHKLDKMVENWKQDPRFSGLKSDKLVAAVREANEIPREKLGIAVLGESVRQLLNTEAKVLYQSADTTIKQIVKRDGQPITALEYLDMQSTLDNAQVVQQIDDQKIAYWNNNGQIFFVVIKTTKQRNENYLVSFRRSSLDEVSKKMSMDDLIKLGVA